jgi:acyl-CoA thioester hydrolase
MRSDDDASRSKAVSEATTLRSTSRVRVRYAETDQMAVVYHATTSSTWFSGATDLLRQSGWSYRELEAEGLSTAGHRSVLPYRQPARYDDELKFAPRAGWRLRSG